MTQPSELADVVQRLHEAFATGDVDAIKRMTSDDEGAVAIGTDHDEWREGRNEIKAHLRKQFAAGQMRVNPDNPRIDQAGDVRWFADRPALVTPHGHDTPFHVTGVSRREGDEWKLIQSHASIGVPNAQAFGP
jgi:ketosteroid isomerase-like protein